MNLEFPAETSATGVLSLLEAERGSLPCPTQLQNSSFVPQTAAGVTEELKVTWPWV